MHGIMGPDRPGITFVSRSLFEWLYAMGVCLGNLALLHAAVYHGLTNNMAVMPSLDALAHDPDEQIRIEHERPTVEERRDWLASLLGEAQADETAHMNRDIAVDAGSNANRGTGDQSSAEGGSTSA